MASRKTELDKTIPDLTPIEAVDAGQDQMIIWDVSAGTTKRVAPGDLPAAGTAHKSSHESGGADALDGDLDAYQDVLQGRPGNFNGNNGNNGNPPLA
jgi:hypothetical protein